VAGLPIRWLGSVDFEAAAVWLNGTPAVRIDAAGGLNAAVSVAVEDGRITRIYVIANPHQPARLDGVAALTVLTLRSPRCRTSLGVGAMLEPSVGGPARSLPRPDALSSSQLSTRFLSDPSRPQFCPDVL
jgi:hypothetical protein